MPLTGARIEAVCVLQTDGGAEAGKHPVWNARSSAALVQCQPVSALHSASQHVP